MLKPNFRFLIIPLGAICTLASLSAQTTAPHRPRDGSILVRQQVVDCRSKSADSVCIVIPDGDDAVR